MAEPEVIFVSDEQIDIVTIEGDVDLVITEAASTEVITESAPAEVITIGEQGPPGAAGNFIVLPTLEDVGAFQVVYATSGAVGLADKDTVIHEDKIIGVTDGAYPSGNSANIIVTGVISNPIWALIDGKVYLDTAGNITQTTPVSGFIKQIGTAISATMLLLNIM